MMAWLGCKYNTLRVYVYICVYIYTQILLILAIGCVLEVVCGA